MIDRDIVMTYRENHEKYPNNIKSHQIFPNVTMLNETFSMIFSDLNFIKINNQK